MHTHEIIAALDAEILKLTQVRSILSGIQPVTPFLLPKKLAKVVAPAQPAKRQMSEEGRARIAAAQKKRWAAARKADKAAAAAA